MRTPNMLCSKGMHIYGTDSGRVVGQRQHSISFWTMTINVTISQYFS